MAPIKFKRAGKTYAKPGKAGVKIKRKVPDNVKTYVKRQTQANADIRHTFAQSTSSATGGDTMSYTIAYINTMGSVTQGDAYFQRSGDEIRPLSYRFWGHVLCYDVYNITRFILFQFLGDTNTSSPQASSMFCSDIAGSANVNAPYTPLKPEGKNLYNILYDSGPQFTSLASAGYLNENGLYHFDVRIPKKKLRKIKFTTATGSAGTGVIYCCVISDSATSGHPQIQWHSQLRFIS